MFGKLLSLFLITAILNPICCCDAALIADPSLIEEAHDCCDATDGDASQATTPCESKDDCPLEPESISQSTQHVDVKSPSEKAPFGPSLFLLWATDDLSVAPSVELVANARQLAHASQLPASLRLYQAKCVYLI